MRKKEYTDCFETTLIVDCKPPEWIKKAMQKKKRRIKYYADKHNTSLEKAEKILDCKYEEAIENQDGN